MTATTNAVKGGQVPLKIVAAFMSMAIKLIEREPDEPYIGVCHGFPGLGKTQASIFTGNQTNALRVQLGESSSKKHFLEKLLEELGIPDAKGSIPKLADKVKELLSEDTRRPLIIDEADKLAQKPDLLELVREIGDAACCPLLLIGEEQLPRKLERFRNFHDRVYHWMAAQPCDVDDADRIAKAFYPDITIDPDLMKEICRKSKGRVRRISCNLREAREIARNRGIKHVDLKAWGSTVFHTSDSPAMRQEKDLEVR